MFDIGFSELLIIGVIALIVVGPEKLPKLARTVGFWVGKAKRMISEVKADVDREIRNHEIQELEQLRELKDDLNVAKESITRVGDDLSTLDGVDDSEKLDAAPAKESAADTPAPSKS